MTGTCIALNLVLKDGIKYITFTTSNTNQETKNLRPFSLPSWLRCNFERPTFAPLKRLNGWHGNDDASEDSMEWGGSVHPNVFWGMNVGFIDFSIFQVGKM